MRRRANFRCAAIRSAVVLELSSNVGISLIAMNGCHDVAQANSFTRSAVLLTMGYEGTQLATGSGVIARDSSSQLYLITAWHISPVGDQE